MIENPGRRPPEDEARRDLSDEEEKFFGAEHEGERAAERERARPMSEGTHRQEAEEYEAGAAAPAAPRAERSYEGRQEDEPPAPSRDRTDEPANTSARDTTEADSATPLFPPDEAQSLRTRWDGIQTEFVDEPRAAVEKADALVGDVMQRLTDGFSSERSRLEREWDRGDRVSTEDLRVALKRYRSFFDRLLSV